MKATNRIINRYGKEFTWEHKAQTMGFKSKDLADYIIKTFELPLTPEEYRKETIGIYRELFPHSNPMPGSETPVLDDSV